MSSIQTFNEIAEAAAKIFDRKLWDSLSFDEKRLAELLVKSGHVKLVEGPGGVKLVIVAAVFPNDSHTPSAATLVLDRAKGSISVRKNKPSSGAPVAGVVDINHVQFESDSA